MASDGYTQTISTAEFTDTPRLTLEQATGDVTIEAWDNPQIEISVDDEDVFFEVEVSGSQVTVRNQARRAGRSDWGPGEHGRHARHGRYGGPDLSGFGIDVDKITARVERNVARTLRRVGPGFDINIDLGRWASSNDYHIRVPYNCHLTLRTSSGDLNIREVTGTHLLQSTSGDIHMHKIGGNVLVSSASGDLRIDGIEGKMGVKTASGEIGVHAAALQDLSVHTASGDIDLELTTVPERGFEVRSVSGDIKLMLPHDARLTAEVSTLSGDVACGLHHETLRRSPGRNRTLNINGGGASAQISTVSGDVLIDPGNSIEGGGDSERGEFSDEGVSSRRQAELDILQAVERGEITSQEAMQRLSDLGRR